MVLCDKCSESPEKQGEGMWLTGNRFSNKLTAGGF